MRALQQPISTLRPHYPFAGSLARLVDSLCGLARQERPLLWYPYVFSDPADAKWLGVELGGEHAR
jgi:hypothetical protein